MLTTRTGERMVDIKTIAAAMEMAEAEFNAWLEKLLEGTAEENKDMWRRQFKEHLAAMVFLKQISALGHRVACDFESREANIEPAGGK
jgi:trehalose-6-phosphate synthase